MERRSRSTWFHHSVNGKVGYSAQYFDPDAAPITEADARWAFEKAKAALAGVRRLLVPQPGGQAG
jgi:hypothetical protein